jgi:HD-GYP domain-containing protein (c-di-GMP phosphodiesterase class II)
LTQAGCIAVGLAFHHLYVSSGVAKATAREARTALAIPAAPAENVRSQQNVSSNAVKVDQALVKQMLWEADGITLLWTIGLTAATLFMLLTYFQRSSSAGHSQLDVEALRQAQTLVRTQETVIFGLAKLADSRDPDTGAHLERIAQFSSMLADSLRQHPEFRDQITPRFVQLIGLSSALHDIGKVGVEDSILGKPSSLTREERERMQLHTQIGAECLREIERRLGTTNFLQMAREIVSAHHEWWDGGGYPLGVAGEQIPLSARIVAVADVYDALRNKRVYKEALPHEECVRLITEAAGTQFDPRLVEVFLRIEDRFRQLADQFQHLEEQSASSEQGQNKSNRFRGEEHVQCN